MKTIKDIINKTIYGNGITAFLRIAMGLLLIYSGLFKALDMENFSKVIILYGIAPGALVPYAAIIIPFIELLSGLLLFTGYKIKASALVSSLMMILWIIFISVNIYRGKTFECGCFELNRFGIKEEIGLPLLFRDIIFLLILVIIFNARQYNLSIDKKIEQKNLEKL